MLRLAEYAELAGLLYERNGFIAFYGALQVFPALHAVDKLHALDDWNQPGLWRQHFVPWADDGLFFAEDIFGGQFVIRDHGVYSFDPESAEYTHLGDNLNDWAQALLNDWDFFTGASLAKSWQQTHGRLPLCQRLIPRVPFVLGGGFIAKNLLACERVTAMRARAAIARQIHDLADGATITLSDYPPPTSV